MITQVFLFLSNFQVNKFINVLNLQFASMDGDNLPVVKPEFNLKVPPFSLHHDQGGNREMEEPGSFLDEIRNNLWGCDLLLCMFMSALNSYRADWCLRPFPPSFIKNQDKDFNKLRNVCDSIPPLKNLLSDPNSYSDDISKLLHWLFMKRSNPFLKRINPNKVPYPGSFEKCPKPQIVFEVCYNDITIDRNWAKRVNGRAIMLAYHGSAIYNFYSILKVGLQQHFSIMKEILYGNGIYLSNEFSVSSHYAPFGQTWRNSAIGSKLSVIAICEIINDVDTVKCRDSNNKKRSFNEGGVGEIPDKYFVVTDSDMVRVKYLMVYAEKQTKSSTKSFLVKHYLYVILLVLYLMVIIGVGAFNNANFVKGIKKMFK